MKLGSMRLLFSVTDSVIDNLLLIHDIEDTSIFLGEYKGKQGSVLAWDHTNNVLPGLVRELN